MDQGESLNPARRAHLVFVTMKSITLTITPLEDEKIPGTVAWLANWLTGLRLELGVHPKVKVPAILWSHTSTPNSKPEVMAVLDAPGIQSHYDVKPQQRYNWFQMGNVPGFQEYVKQHGGTHPAYVGMTVYVIEPTGRPGGISNEVRREGIFQYLTPAAHKVVQTLLNEVAAQLGFWHYGDNTPIQVVVDKSLENLVRPVGPT